MEDRHPIKVVARRTALTPHVIRAWEKRYHAVVPDRTATNRRVYTNEDIERLLLLRRATLAGRSIGQIARLPTGQLRELVSEDERAQSHAPVGRSTLAASRTSNGELEVSFRALERLDADLLQASLERASVSMSRPAFVEETLVPLLERIGDCWRDGTLRVASEHLASATVRTLLGSMNGAFPISAGAPRLVVTTPAGQLHELGALLAATAAASEGWHITYLGPSLPAEEIAAAAEKIRARAVALSIIVYDDAHLTSELRRLVQLLPPNVTLLVGGRGSAHYSGLINDLGAKRLSDLPSFRMALESLSPGSSSPSGA